MTDASDISLLAVGFLSENLAKGVLSAVGKDVWAFLTDIFSTEKAKIALQDFEKNPSDSVTQGKIIGKLEEILDENPLYGNQLEKLLANAPTSYKVNTQTIKGNHNIVMQDVKNGNINVKDYKNDK